MKCAEGPEVQEREFVLHFKVMLRQSDDTTPLASASIWMTRRGRVQRIHSEIHPEMSPVVILNAPLAFVDDAVVHHQRCETERLSLSAGC